MPKLPLLSSAYGRQRETYNVPRLVSYAGYPVVSAKSLGLESYFNADGKNVAGMAWGGRTNPPGQGGPQQVGGAYESPSIVPNQNYFKDDPRAYNALVKLEASRHWMGENNYSPKFKITPEMQKWREEQFSKTGPAGKAYLNDDLAFKQTIISRVIGGDGNIPKLPEAVYNEAKTITNKLEEVDKKSKPTVSQSIMSAMGMKGRK